MVASVSSSENHESSVTPSSSIANNMIIGYTVIGYTLLDRGDSASSSNKRAFHWVSNFWSISEWRYLTVSVISFDTRWESKVFRNISRQGEGLVGFVCRFYKNRTL